MNQLLTILLIAALVVLHVFIGGTRLLYALPAYALLGAAGIATLLPGGKLRCRVGNYCLATTTALTIYIAARAFVSPVDYLARPDLFLVLACFVTYIVVACYLCDSEQRLTVFIALAFLAIAHSAIGAVQFKNGEGFMPLPWIRRIDTSGRASGFYISPNHLAGVLEAVGLMLISLVCWGRSKGWRKPCLAYAAAMCFLGIAITGSRGGYISTFFGLCLFSLISLRLCGRLKCERLFLLTAVGLGGAVVFGGGLFLIKHSRLVSNRVSMIYEPENMRRLLWAAALRQFAIQPVVGTGAGTYLYYGREFRSPKVQNDPIHVHNDYLELLAEYGVVGVVIFGGFFFVHARAGLRRIDSLTRRMVAKNRVTSHNLALNVGAVSAVGAYLTHSVVDFNLHIPGNAVMMAFIFGILASPRKEGELSPGEQRVGAFARLVLPAVGVVLIACCVKLLPGEYLAERARTALRDNELPEAIDFVAQAITRESRNPDLFYYLGEAQRLSAAMAASAEESAALNETALESFDRGLALFPRDVRILLKKARTLDVMQRFEEAAQVLTRAQELDPNLGNVYAFWGLHFHDQNLIPEAIEQYRKAMSMEGNAIASGGMDAIRREQQAAQVRGQVNPDLDAPPGVPDAPPEQ